MKIIIVGCGRHGSGLARSLSRKGHIITVIDQESSSFELLGPSFSGKTITGVGLIGMFCSRRR